MLSNGSDPYRVKLVEDLVKKKKTKVAKNIFVTKNEKKNVLKKEERRRRRKMKHQPLLETSSQSDEDPDQLLTVSTDDKYSKNDCECPFCN